MPDPLFRRAGNVPGPVFVDDTCICCMACIAVAPDHFDDPEGEVVCVRQPDTAASRAACLEAAAVCPVEAIGGVLVLQSERTVPEV